MTDVKQVKVDNWGIFFLQRLQQFFNRTDFCDLTLLFENNVQLKVHRLVINACTEYFQLLENTCEVIDNGLVMPIDLQPDVVVPIINFMYTGQLEFLMSNYDKLYAAAKLMKMTVLTKLLDAQKVPVKPVAVPRNKRYTIGPVTWNLQGKKVTPKKPLDADLPDPLPGCKLPIWKRRKTPGIDVPVTKHIPEILTPYKVPSKHVDNTPRPTRFEWPGGDLPTVSFFDDISYHSEPLTANSVPKATETNSSAVFEEIKRTASTLKRPLPTNEIPSDKTINLKDVKEFLEEQRVRNDYILKNDLSQDDEEETGGAELILGADPPKNKEIKILEDVPLTKKVKFNVEGKENTKTVEAKVTSSDNINDHTNLIAEVLKKYPHLMQKNKNIKLKIIKRNFDSPLQKGKKFSYTIKEELNKGEVCIIVDQAEEVVEEDEEKAKEEEEDEEEVVEDDVKTVIIGDEQSLVADFYCRECSLPPNQYVQFKNYPDFVEHVTEFHPNMPASRICPTCGFQALNETSLVHHVYVKHEIELPSFKRKRFPRCKKCSYIALNSVKLKIHINEHTYSTLCRDCDETLPTYIDFVKHSFNLKHNQSQEFNCPFCVKKFIRINSLYTHMRTHHANEYLEEEFEVSPSKALETISHLPQDNVTEPSDTDLEIRSTPSSEAEALNNVASGIAASLGLVDTIVVLDNEQYVLQSDEQSDQQNQQIVITGVNGDDNPVVTQQDQQNTMTITTTSNTSMTSTDELVMVLTDHNYGDEANTMLNAENSNIVVLYSHPIENQGEFISQPNDIILNHSTNEILEMPPKGMVEAPEENLSSLDVSQENIDTKSQPETIELIQEEVNKHLSECDKTEEEEEIVSQAEDESKVDEASIVDPEPVQPEPMEVCEEEASEHDLSDISLQLKSESDEKETNEIPDEINQQENVEKPEEDNVENTNESETNECEAMEVDGSTINKDNTELERNDESFPEGDDDKTLPQEKNLEVISSSSSDECILIPDEIKETIKEETSDDLNEVVSVDNANSQDDKNNVTDLVSDWCDDDSGQPNCEKKPTDEEAVEVKDEEMDTKDEEQVKTTDSGSVKVDDKGVENVKINKLLDDWDDVDTDSQKSNEATQSLIKIPITNLIDDWADDE